MLEKEGNASSCGRHSMHLKACHLVKLLQNECADCVSCPEFEQIHKLECISAILRTGTPSQQLQQQQKQCWRQQQQQQRRQWQCWGRQQQEHQHKYSYK